MTRPRLLVLTAVTLLATFGLAPGALAADTTGPTLKAARSATFVVGSQIGPMAPDANGDPIQTDKILMTTSWSASDPSGICGYRWRATYAGLDPDPWTAWGSTHSATYSTTDYDDQQGGGSFKFEGIDVQARDCSHNITQRSVSFGPAVYQDDGRSYGWGTLDVTYHGSWSVSRCACWSSGTTHKSSSKGASVSFLVNDPQASSTGATLLGLVMETAPDRGQVQVLIDGKVSATVDTYSPTPQHRTVVWAGYLPKSGHTVTVVNLGTANRPRVDVDALVTA